MIEQKMKTKNFNIDLADHKLTAPFGPFTVESRDLIISALGRNERTFKFVDLLEANLSKWASDFYSWPHVELRNEKIKSLRVQWKNLEKKLIEFVNAWDEVSELQLTNLRWLSPRNRKALDHRVVKGEGSQSEEESTPISMLAEIQQCLDSVMKLDPQKNKNAKSYREDVFEIVIRSYNEAFGEFPKPYFKETKENRFLKIMQEVNFLCFGEIISLKSLESPAYKVIRSIKQSSK